MVGTNFSGRMEKLQSAIGRAQLEGVMVVPGPNMAYLTGVHSLLLERPFMLFVPAEGTAQLVAPALESGPYMDASLNLTIHSWTDSEGAGGAIKAAVKKLRMKGRWGVEGRAPFRYLNSVMAYASPSAADAEPILQGLREIKDESEARLLRMAARILSRSFLQFPGMLGEGMTEIELRRKAGDAIADNGATEVDDLLVQSGPRSADPHSPSSTRKIGRGDSVVMDLTCTFEGYYADITRTFCLSPSKEFEDVYAAVLEAQERAIETAGGGVEVGSVDAAARGSLTRAGLGRQFTHRTGHGLGLEVHEAPYIVEGGKEVLNRNMCFTVEPGVYLRGKLGVRIEDNLIIEGKRAAVTTDPPKEFGWWR